MRMILQRNFRDVIRRLNRYTTMVGQEGEKNTIVIAISGGVDSSVAAHLVQEQVSGKTDQNLIGLYMKNWNDTENGAYCEVSERDVRDVQQVCDMLNIPLHHVSFAAEYWTQVFEPFLDDMSSSSSPSGSMKTPNPDINCNSQIKFGTMREYAHTNLHASLIVTGHYARLWHRHTISHTFLQKENDELEELIQSKIDQEPSLNHWIRDWGSNMDTPLLVAAKDLTKDQSYFLSGVSSFHNVWFPLGNYYKNNTHTSSSSSIRQLAQEYKLPNAQKKDSMGICFIGNSRNKNQFSQFLSQYITQPSESIKFIDIDTQKLVSTTKQEKEKSKNDWSPPYYTIGQGAKLSGASTKWFVTTTTLMNENYKDDHVIWVCNDTHHPSLYTNELYINKKDFNWIVGGSLPPPPLTSKTNKGTLQAFCRMRHLQPIIPCTIKWYVYHDINNICNFLTCAYQ